MKPNRRQLLAMLAATGCTQAPREGGQSRASDAGDAGRFRLAICNETFQGWDVVSGFRGALETGYTGVEIAPFTLSEPLAVN